jgi:hypothetical protein
MTDELDTGGTPAPQPAPAPADTPAPQPAPAPAAQDWPDDWRVKLADGDEKKAKSWEKYNSPKDVAHAYKSLEQQLSSGEYVKRLPKDAKPEQVAEWRKNNGIPESADKYDFNLPDGLVLGEEDLTVARDFATAMHGVNADQKTVQTALTWWTKNQQVAMQAMQERDAEQSKKTEDVLRAEWGGEYRMNEAAIGNALAGMPEDLSAAVREARAPDSTRLFDNPNFRSYLLKQAYLENPARMVVPGGDGNSIDNINQQLEEIKRISQTEPQRYMKDTAMQERRQKLLQAQSVLQKRAG